MIAYLDASVVLRLVLDAPEALREWPQLEEGVSSALMRVECYRTLERLWRNGELTADELMRHRLQVETIISRLRTFAIGDDVLHLAAEPLPTPLKTLDAIHLASAIIHRRAISDSRNLLFATHDHALAKAARDLHFEVIGT